LGCVRSEDGRIREKIHCGQRLRTVAAVFVMARKPLKTGGFPDGRVGILGESLDFFRLVG